MVAARVPLEVRARSREPAVVRSPRLEISPGDCALLVKWSRRRTLAARIVLRSRIILLLADTGSVKAVADALGVASGTVRLWRRRFKEHGPNGLLQDAPGRGRKPALEPAARQMLRTGAGLEQAASVRARARALGVSPATVSRSQRPANGCRS